MAPSSRTGAGETETRRERRRGGDGGDVEGEIMSLSPCIPPPAHNAHFSPFSQQIRFSGVGQNNPPTPNKANEREMRARRGELLGEGERAEYAQ